MDAIFAGATRYYLPEVPTYDPNMIFTYDAFDAPVWVRDYDVFDTAYAHKPVVRLPPRKKAEHDLLPYDAVITGPGSLTPTVRDADHQNHVQCCAENDLEDSLTEDEPEDNPGEDTFGANARLEDLQDAEDVEDDEDGHLLQLSPMLQTFIDSLDSFFQDDMPDEQTSPAMTPVYVFDSQGALVPFLRWALEERRIREGLLPQRRLRRRPHWSTSNHSPLRNEVHFSADDTRESADRVQEGAGNAQQQTTSRSRLHASHLPSSARVSVDLQGVDAAIQRSPRDWADDDDDAIFNNILQQNLRRIVTEDEANDTRPAAARLASAADDDLSTAVASVPSLATSGHATNLSEGTTSRQGNHDVADLDHGSPTPTSSSVSRFCRDNALSRTWKVNREFPGLINASSEHSGVEEARKAQKEASTEEGLRIKRERIAQQEAKWWQRKFEEEYAKGQQLHDEIWRMQKELHQRKLEHEWEVDDLGTALDEAQAEVKLGCHELDSAQLQIEDLQEQLRQANRQFDSIQQAVVRLLAKNSNLEKELNEANEALAAAQKAAAAQHAELAAYKEAMHPPRNNGGLPQTLLRLTSEAQDVAVHARLEASALQADLETAQGLVRAVEEDNNRHQIVAALIEDAITQAAVAVTAARRGCAEADAKVARAHSTAAWVQQNRNTGATEGSAMSSSPLKHAQRPRFPLHRVGLGILQTWLLAGKTPAATICSRVVAA